jgi:signal transduction histidine kinase
VEIHYDEGELRLRIRDDGKEIDRIPGMRERAQKIGSRLDFWSEKGAGTEVQLTVPAAIGYQKTSERPSIRPVSPGVKR